MNILVEGMLYGCLGLCEEAAFQLNWAEQIELSPEPEKTKARVSQPTRFHRFFQADSYPFPLTSAVILSFD